MAVSVVRVESKAACVEKEPSQLAAVVEHGDVLSNMDRRCGTCCIKVRWGDLYQSLTLLDTTNPNRKFNAKAVANSFLRNF